VVAGDVGHAARQVEPKLVGHVQLQRVGQHRHRLARVGGLSLHHALGQSDKAERGCHSTSLTHRLGAQLLIEHRSLSLAPKGRQRLRQHELRSTGALRVLRHVPEHAHRPLMLIEDCVYSTEQATQLLVILRLQDRHRGVTMTIRELLDRPITRRGERTCRHKAHGQEKSHRSSNNVQNGPRRVSEVPGGAALHTGFAIRLQLTPAGWSQRLARSSPGPKNCHPPRTA
jgi:hypothetical protein